MKKRTKKRIATNVPMPPPTTGSRGTISKQRPLTRGYLEALRENTKGLPAFLHDEMMTRARATAGGRARWSKPEIPSPLIRQGLTTLTGLDDLPEADLVTAWNAATDWRLAVAGDGSDDSLILDIMARLVSASSERDITLPGSENLTDWAIDNIHRQEQAVKKAYGGPINGSPDLVAIEGVSGVWSAFYGGFPAYYVAEGDRAIYVGVVLPIAKVAITENNIIVKGSFKELEKGIISHARQLAFGLVTDGWPALQLEYQPISKAVESEKKLVYGVVMTPDSSDLQGDTISPEELEKAAHDYMISSRVVGAQHSVQADAVPVESYIAPMDFSLPDGGEIKKGAWVLVVKVLDDDIWERVKNGDLNSFSPAGLAIRRDMG